MTGSYFLNARNVAEVREAHATGTRVLLRDARPDLPESFVRVVECALSQKPDHRYQSAGAMESALAAASDSHAAAAPATWPRSASSPRSRVSRLRRASILAAALLAAAAAAAAWMNAHKRSAPVIAVLPFKNLSTEADSDYFVDGLTEEVVRNLSVIDGLNVRSSASSFVFKNKNPGTREFGQQLNANLVLSASVLRQGPRLRIDAQLVRAADDVPLWSARYDRELKDIFAIQDEISRSIVNELRLKLGRGQRRYTTNVEAYDRYLKARVLQSRRGPATRQAIDLFDEVVDKDAGFAPAYAARARSLTRGSPRRDRLGPFARPRMGRGGEVVPSCDSTQPEPHDQFDGFRRRGAPPRREARRSAARPERCAPYRPPVVGCATDDVDSADQHPSIRRRARQLPPRD